MNLIEQMLQKAFEMGEVAAQRAHDIKVPDNYVLSLNPYKGFGRNSELAWQNGFHHKKMQLSN